MLNHTVRLHLTPTEHHLISDSPLSLKQPYPNHDYGVVRIRRLTSPAATTAAESQSSPFNQSETTLGRENGMDSFAAAAAGEAPSAEGGAGGGDAGERGKKIHFGDTRGAIQ